MLLFHFMKIEYKQLAMDSIGVSAYEWAQEPENTLVIPNLPKKPFGVVLGIAEFMAPTLCRSLREVPATYTLEDRLFRGSALLRDTVVSLASFTAFAVASYATHNSEVSLASFCVTKFILNGVVHEELRRNIL